MASTLPSGNTHALPGISLLGLTRRNVYSLLAERPQTPLSRCAFWLRLSGHFCYLLLKSFTYCICKNIFYLFLQSYTFCSLWKKKKITVIEGCVFYSLFFSPSGPRIDFQHSRVWQNQNQWDVPALTICTHALYMAQPALVLILSLQNLRDEYKWHLLCQIPEFVSTKMFVFRLSFEGSVQRQNVRGHTVPHLF